MPAYMQAYLKAAQERLQRKLSECQLKIMQPPRVNEHILKVYGTLCTGLGMVDSLMRERRHRFNQRHRAGYPKASKAVAKCSTTITPSPSLTPSPSATSPLPDPLTSVIAIRG